MGVLIDDTYLIGGYWRESGDSGRRHVGPGGFCVLLRAEVAFVLPLRRIISCGIRTTT